MNTSALRHREDTEYTKATYQMRLSNVQRSAFWCGALVVVALALGCGGSPALQEHPHHIAKRSFFILECKGIYEATIFAKVDNVCSDCFSLFREYELHALCRKDCFTSHYYKGCMQSLQMEDQIEEYKIYVKQLNGAHPEV